MLAGQRYILCGLSRLTVRVAKRLSANHAQVVVVPLGEGHERLLSDLDTDTEIVTPKPGEDLVRTLETAGIGQAHCLLALAEDDLDNLRAVVAAREVAPEVPAVVRAFDPALAQGLEQGLNIRRAYSVSALAAPAFVAAACGDRVLETLRLGEGEVPICIVTVRPNSPLGGLTPAEIDRRYQCRVIAHAGEGSGWRMVSGEEKASPVSTGDRILVGGLLGHVLALIGKNAALGSGDRLAGASRRSRLRPAPRARGSSFRHTRLPVVAFSLVALMVVSVAVFAFALKLSLVDAIYFVITTATTTGYGDISLKDSPAWLKLYGNLVMISGGALLGVLFSYLSAVATTERLEEMMGKRASGMSGHVVVAGLGNVGYRVVRNLLDMEWDVAALELASGTRFVEALREAAPVLAGDARLPENLERVAISQASVFIACTNDELANIQACLHARRLNPSIRTVARVYEDSLAERLTGAFRIDAALSASQVAAGAFFGAAADERAMRAVTIGELDLLACRLNVSSPEESDLIQAAGREGVVLLGFVQPSGELFPAEAGVVAPGCQAVACGPAGSLRDLANRMEERRQGRSNQTSTAGSVSLNEAKS